MALDVAMIMRLVDRFSAPARKMEQSADRIAQKARKIGDSSRGFDRLNAAARRAASTMSGPLNTAAFKVGQGIGALTRNLAGSALGMAKWGAAAAGLAGGAFIGGIVRTGMQFEQFEAQLEGTEGSALKAKKALEWVMKFAATTPYEMEEVADAFVRARNKGIDPYTGAMKSMGDAASANRKTMVEAVEAIADAQAFQFERLNEFGITSKSLGGSVSFSFIGADGKTEVKTVKKDMATIRDTVLEIWSARHGGAMIRQSKTLTGLWSNIKDQVTLFQYKIGQAGWFNNLKNKAAELLETLDSWNNSGKLDEWAKRVSTFLSEMTDKAYDFVVTTDWRAVASDVATLAGAFGAVASKIADVIRFASDLSSKIRDLHANMAILGMSPVYSRAQGMQHFQNEAIRKRAEKWSTGPNPFMSGGAKPGGGKYSDMSLPTLGRKVSMGPQKHEFTVRVKADPGTSASARVSRAANGSSYSTPRIRRGPSMGAAA